MISKHYQFRADPDLEAKLHLVWNKHINTTRNLARILEAGVKALVKGEGGHK